MQRQCFLLCFVLTAILIAGCKKESDYDFGNYAPRPSTPVDGKTYSAAEIAGFKQMMQEESSNTPFVKKWNRDTVDVYLADTSNTVLNAELQVIFDDIKAASNNRLVLRRTGDSLVPVKIYFNAKAAFLQRFPSLAPFLTGSFDDRTGYCYIWWSGNYTIYQSVVFIDKEKLATTPIHLRYIARHELMHALGFLTHVSFNEFSTSAMYHQYNGVTQFSPFDKRMIGLLYTPTLTAGLTGEALNKILLEL